MSLPTESQSRRAIAALRREISQYCIEGALTDEDEMNILAQGFQPWLGKLDADQREHACRVIAPHLPHRLTLES